MKSARPQEGKTHGPIIAESSKTPLVKWGFTLPDHAMLIVIKHANFRPKNTLLSYSVGEREFS